MSSGLAQSDWGRGGCDPRQRSSIKPRSPTSDRRLGRSLAKHRSDTKYPPRKKDNLICIKRSDYVDRHTSADLHTVDLEEFKYGQTKITGLRLVDVDSPELQNFLDDWKRLAQQPKHTRAPPAPGPHLIKTETALMYDAVKLFAMGLQQLDLTKAVDFPVISCDAAESSSDGSSLINLMRPVSTSVRATPKTLTVSGWPARH
ncbi:glutamate receptor [Tropilaelaps mercedesae]|uniref:Glutamate receptor n=1 Tax=Tropilaelaps mercedesae TaxID=418985 RepID=A0A1V9X6V2_9ACAR|nr:glutamate receptor [Tropilaelaps mercedesae]